MYARIATYRGAGSEQLEMLLPQLAEQIARDLDQPPPGLEGLREVLLLVDRDQGRALGLTLFDTEDDLNRGDEALSHMPMSRAGGVRTEVERYEVVLRRARS